MQTQTDSFGPIFRANDSDSAFLCAFYESETVLLNGRTHHSVLENVPALPTSLTQLETFFRYHIAIIGMKTLSLHFGNL